MPDKVLFVNQYPVWIKILHPNHLEYVSQIEGKWVHHDTPKRLGEIASDLVDLIVTGLTPEIKYRPTLNDPSGPFAHLSPPICIYSTSQNKEELYRRLQKYGLKDIYWQSEEATRERNRKQTPNCQP